MYYRRDNGYKYLIDFGDFKLTKGELIILCVAFVIWTTICVFINMSITNATLENNSKYYKAVKIDNDEELFKYGMRTHAGNALVYGEVKAAAPVSIPELSDSYFAIEKVTEKYTEHVTYDEDEDGNRTKNVSYSWDTCWRETYLPDNVIFSGVEFPYNKIEIDNFRRLDLSDGNVSKSFSDKFHFNRIYEKSHIWERVGDKRYYYCVIPLSQKVTIFAELKDNTIYGVDGSENARIYYNTTTQEVIEGIEKSKNYSNIGFTILWYLLYIALGFWFIYQRNKWADC